MRNILVLVILLTAACAKKPILEQAELQAFAPLPAAVPGKASGPLDKQVVLGRMLYYETRLSRSQTISCNSCHDLSKYGVDGEATS